MTGRVLQILGAVLFLGAVALYVVPRLSPPLPGPASEPAPGLLPPPESFAAGDVRKPVRPAALPEGFDAAFEAMRELETGRAEEAEARVRAAIEADGESPLNLTMLGFVQMHQGEPEEAKESFERVLADEPDHALALAGRGLLALGWHQYDRAVEDLVAACARSPGQGEWLRALSVAKLGTGEIEAAFHAALAALRTDPGRAGFYEQVADCLLRSGREKEALLWYSKARERGATEHDEPVLVLLRARASS